MFTPNPFAYAVGMSGFRRGSMKHATISNGFFPGGNDVDLRLVAPVISSVVEDQLRAFAAGADYAPANGSIPIYTIEADDVYY